MNGYKNKCHAQEFMSVYLLFLNIRRVGPANLKGVLWFSSKESLIL